MQYCTTDTEKGEHPNLWNIVLLPIERARLDLQQNVRQHLLLGARRVAAHNRAVGLRRVGEIVLDNQTAERGKEQRRLVAAKRVGEGRKCEQMT